MSFNHALATTEAPANLRPGAWVSEDQPEGSLDIEHGYFLVLKNEYNGLRHGFPYHGFPYATMVKARKGMDLFCTASKSMEVATPLATHCGNGYQHTTSLSLARHGIRLGFRCGSVPVFGSTLPMATFGSECAKASEAKQGRSHRKKRLEPDFSLNDIELGREALSLTTRLDGFEEMEAPDEDDDDLCEGSW